MQSGVGIPRCPQDWRPSKGAIINLRRKQELFLDAAEISFEFIAFTYMLLLDAIRSHDPRERDGLSPNVRMLYAWGIVDHAERLREVLEHTPGLKQNTVLETFTAQLRQSVKPFRDHFQHMEDKAAAVAETGFPILGSISWCRAISVQKLEIGVFVPGRLAKCEGLPVVNPVGRKLHSDIDHVEISLGQDTLNVSELCRDISRFSSAFARAWKSATEEASRDDSGLLRFEILK